MRRGFMDKQRGAYKLKEKLDGFDKWHGNIYRKLT